jgi:L-lactate dehydrogenase (cytochrome)
MNRLLRTLHLRSERHYGKKVAQAQTTEDLWRLLEERVPPIVREYFRGAADEEITLRGNVQAFRQTMTTAWGALKLDQLDLRTTVVGHELGVPFFVAPVGSLGALWPDAEAIAAKVAGEFRTVMALSTLTLTPMEKVRAASTGNCYFQLYLCGGREVATRGIERAKKAGFSALILTIDSGVAGNRVVHARMKPMAALQSFSGLSARERSRLLRETLSVLPQMLEHHRWLTSYWAGGGKMEFVNIQLDQKGTPMPYADIGTQLLAAAGVIGRHV